MLALAHAHGASNKPAAMKILHQWGASTANPVRAPYPLATIYGGLGQKE